MAERLDGKPKDYSKRKKRGQLSKEAFFKKIAGRASYLNPAIVEEVYREMMRVVVHELKMTGEVTLPDFIRMNIRRKAQSEEAKIKFGIHNIIVYNTDYKLRAFFRNRLNLPLPETDD
jgi:nucleoid DNA-binding protein